MLREGLRWAFRWVASGLSGRETISFPARIGWMHSQTSARPWPFAMTKRFGFRRNRALPGISRMGNVSCKDWNLPPWFNMGPKPTGKALSEVGWGCPKPCVTVETGRHTLALGSDGRSNQRGRGKAPALARPSVFRSAPSRNRKQLEQNNCAGRTHSCLDRRRKTLVHFSYWRKEGSIAGCRTRAGNGDGPVEYQPRPFQV